MNGHKVRKVSIDYLTREGAKNQLVVFGLLGIG